jgi:signal transduction histidine kinase
VSTSTEGAKQLVTYIAASAPAADGRPLEPTAALVVPLAARGRRLGCVVLAATEPGRRYDKPELALCEELSRTCAIALDNARLYRDAQAALRAREDFLTVAAHEVRTPLTSLRLRLAAAQRSLRHADVPLDRHTLEAAVATAVRQTDRLSRLTDLLLEATSETRLVEREVDLVEVARDTAARLSEDARNAGCRIELRAPARVIGSWDATRLHHALTNLLLNAIKFGSNAPIEIDVRADADTAELTVVDHGMGIAEDKQRIVFERFGRGVSTRHYGGLGLGLYVARRIVERHGGSLTVQSNPGAGARFTVTLPLHVSPAALDRAS